MYKGEVHARRWYMLPVILLPTLMISLNTYMLQVALPSLQRSLNASFAEAQLMLTGFSLGLAISLMVGGKLGDLYGRRKMLLIGLAVFTMMAALGGMTSNPTTLIILRIVQGLAAALVQPQVLSILQVSFLPREKGLVFGLYGAWIGVGFAFGLMLGGILVHWNPFELGWRAVFYFHVPLGGIVLLLLPFLPETKGSRGQRIDWAGSSLLMVGLFLLVYPLSEGQKQGWPLWIWGGLLLGAAILWTFIRVERWRQRKDGSALVDLSIFRHRSYRIGMITVVIVYLSMFSFFFILSYYLQYGLDYEVSSTSFVYLPLGVGYFLSSLGSARLVQLWGMKVLRAGALIMAGAIAALVVSLQVDAVQMLDVQNVIILSIYGVGLGLVTTPLVPAVLRMVPAKDAGTGSGLFSTFMYVSNALGVALISMLFSYVLRHPLLEAAQTDYIRAFSVALLATGALALAAFASLRLLRE